MFCFLFSRWLLRPFVGCTQNALQNYYKYLEYTRFLPKKYRLCSHKQYFSEKRLLFAQTSERKFGGNPPVIRRSLTSLLMGRGVPKLHTYMQVQNACHSIFLPFWQSNGPIITY